MSNSRPLPPINNSENKILCGHNTIIYHVPSKAPWLLYFFYSFVLA